MKWQSSPAAPHDHSSPDGRAMRSSPSETGTESAPPPIGNPPPPPQRQHHLAAIGHPHAPPRHPHPHDSPHHAHHHNHHSHPPPPPRHHVAPPPPMYRHPYGHPRHSPPHPPPPPSHYDHHPHHHPATHTRGVSGGYYDYHPQYRSPSSYPPSMPPPPPSPHHHQHHYGGGPATGPPTGTTPRPYGVDHSAAAAELRASPPRENQSPSSSYSPIDPFRNGGCTCKKSRCLKLYCQCFALSTTCGPKCKCQTCQNTTLHAEAIEEARKTILERNPSAFDDKFRGSPSPYRPAYSPPATSNAAWATQTYATTGPTTTATTTTMVAPRIATGPPPRVNKYGCKCRRSFCLKKYCECYQNSVHCGLNCRCVNCHNYPKEDGSSQGPPPPSTMGVPVPIQERVSLPSPTMAASSSKSVSSSPPPPQRLVSGGSRSELQEDRMAIMAAVAMTELLGGNKSPRRVSMDASKNNGVKRKATEEASPLPAPPRPSATYDSPPSLRDSPSEEEEQQRPHKRPNVKETSIVSTETSPIRGMPTEESRNPSPATATMSTSPQHHSRLPPQRYHYSTVHAHHHAHPHLRHHQPPLPPKLFPYYASPPRGGPLAPPPPRLSPTSYEDVVKSSGLPKALSFRKICSKCGKTRGEHGELGFGNKCVYQDCGKCGAGVQMHLKAGVPMGILCRLTVDEGAIPGASAGYERKISDLAKRAELQKTLLDDKRERAERMAKAYP